MSHDKVSSYDDEGLLKIPPYEEDEATMEASWEGGFDSSMLMDGFRTEDKRPKDRRIRAEKLSTYLLIGFLGIMLITLIPLSARKNRSNVGSDVSDAVKENTPRAPIADAHNIEPNTCVHCTGHRQGLTIDEWLSQGIDDSAALCDPEVRER